MLAYFALEERRRIYSCPLASIRGFSEALASIRGYKSFAEVTLDDPIKWV
jgi:hypothetical protein